MNEKYWYLKRCPVFSDLSPEQLQTVESSCYAREFSRGEMIYLPSDHGDSVMLLARGRVRVYHVTHEGKQAILGFVEPGELFGELSAFNGSRREEYAEAMEKTLVVLMPRAVVQRLMQQHPGVSIRLTSLFGLRLKRVERRLKSLLFRSSRERLVHLLLELAEKYGRRTEDGVLIAQKISHQDMASIIGATRETVTITLGELQSEGILQINRRRITLKDCDGLALATDFGPLTAAFSSCPAG
ncbi:MAG: Crp/Fnr family transcriptional regulator [Fuerstiella sp.]